MRVLKILILAAGCMVAAQAVSAFQKAGAAQPVKRGAAERHYERGQRALDNQRWEEAVAAFTAAQDGPRADAALYWKAWSLHRLGRRDEALAALETLRAAHPNSRWLKDADALQLEIRQAAGQSVSPESQADDELKLIALQGLMHSDPERALPLVEKLLAVAQSPRIKERALFVLANAQSPRARELLAQAARGGVNPDLQMKAITYLAVMGGDRDERLRLLSEIYAAHPDAAVRRAVLRGFMAAGARDRLAHAARSEADAALRKEAVQLLGAAGGIQELRQLYAAEKSPEIRRQIQRALMVGGDAEFVIQAARTEKDPELRRDAVRLLGAMGSANAAEALAAMYPTERDPEIRRAIIDGLFHRGDARTLVDLARKETDPQLRKRIVERLARMKSKEATEYLMEVLEP